VKRRPTGGQDPGGRRRRQQVSHEATRRQHLLDIVENQQDVPVVEVAAQVCQQRPAAGVLQPEGLRD
jgi:hypothetical protein